MARTSPIPRTAGLDAARNARASAVAVWLTAACAGLSCGSPASSSARPVTRQVIAAASGGTASTANGRFKVQVPPNALQKDVAITIQQIDPPASGAIGPVYEVGPTGTLFQRPVTLSFSFAGLALAGADSTTLHVATFSGGKWVPVASSVDRASSLVTGQITHLSPWTLIVYTDVVPPEPDASTGDMDAGADAPSGGGGQGGSAGGAGIGGGTGGAKAGAGGGGAGAGGSAGAGGGGQAGGQGGAGAGGKGGAGAGGQGGAGAGGQGGAGGAAGASGQGGAGQGGAAGQGVDASPDANTTDVNDAGASDADPDAAFT